MDAINEEILVAELVSHEGEKLKAYKDTATPPCWTIGVGRNLDAKRGASLGISSTETATLKITRASCLSKGITRDQSRALLRNDIDAVFHDLDGFLPWWRKMDPVRQRVIANMCFNLGITKLLGFHATLSAMKAGRYAEAAIHMLDSKWASDVKGRADYLANLMRLGAKK